MSSKSGPSSEEVRQKGNELYKTGRIAESLLFYKRAAELSPAERAPWSNLSAAYFELGDYTKAISACDTALSLLDLNAEDYDAIKQKHVVRRAKSYLFAGLYKDAATAVLADFSAAEDVLSRCVEQYSSASESIVDPVKARNEIILNLPRYKPTLINTAEFYPIGHDTPESLYDATLNTSPRPTVSFLFGGIGDARNLFQSLIQIAAQDRKASSGSRKFYHFTIVDIKSPAIARDLVVLLLLDGLSEIADSPEKMKSSKLMLCLVYTYLSSIMPNSLYDLIQEKIAEAKLALMQDRLPSYIEIPGMYRAEVLRYLDDWQNKVQQEYPVTRLQPQIVQTRAQDEQQQMPFGGSAEFMNLPPTLAKEQQFEALTGAAMLPAPHSKLLAPELRKAFDAFNSRAAPSVVKGAVHCVRNTWSTNVTMVDLDWEHTRDPDPFMDIDVGSCPYSLCAKLEEIGIKPHKAKSFLDYALPWLSSVAQALRQIRGRLRIEACVGDVTAVLEQIKYGAVGHRRQVDVSEQPVEALHENTYPQMYDRIHLSNVPDYVGGTLTSYLYALQLTHPGQHSYVTSTCLRNPPRFKSAAEFDAEYVALYAEKDLEKLFHVRMEPTDDEFMPMPMPMPMCAYNKWHHSIASRKYADLVPRAKVEAWLYRLFFKVAIPLERRMIVDNGLIYSPLNLTFFFRLVTHLHTIGYPAHWLSDVLSSILSGSVTTTARPPRSEPLKPREIDVVRKPMTQSLAPFKSEFSTLTAMWQLLLPFGILSDEIAPVKSIKKYSLKLRNFHDATLAYPNFVLVFYKGPLPLDAKYDLRSVLVSDERGSNEYKTFREQRINIVSTWSWHQRSQTATLWLREDAMRKMEEEDWQVCIYRTDNWNPQSEAYNFKSAKLKESGPSWVDKVNGKAAPECDVVTAKTTNGEDGDWRDVDSMDNSE